MKRLGTIDEALDAIYSFVDYSMTHVQTTDAAVFSLAKIRELMTRLGNPQETFRSIHVAGTKGKGSVCALMSSELSSYGYKVGFYSSPHLIDFNERFQINGKMIGNGRLLELINRVLAVIDDGFRPSTFDLMTAIAFCWFAEERVDFAVVETGLGGRLDSTNVVNPILTVITSISMDHTAFLGDTIEAIAGEKAGILKAGVPTVVAPEHPDALKTILTRAKAIGAPVVNVRETYGFQRVADDVHGQDVLFWRRVDQAVFNRWLDSAADEFSPARFHLNLVGLYQVLNAATAAAGLIRLKADGYLPDAGLSFNGFAGAEWPGRFEVMRLDGERTVVLDGAHNPDSAEKLTVAVNRYFGVRRIGFVVGFSEDKNAAAMIETFGAVGSVFIATRSTHPRAADPAEIAAQVRVNGRPVSVCETLEGALAEMRRMTDVEVFIVTGSLFVAGGMRSLLLGREL